MMAAPAQTPVAVVEEVKGEPSGVEFMDYVAPGVKAFPAWAKS